MKKYACCPICGYKLCKSEEGTDTDVLCPRCGQVVNVKIADIVTVHIISKEERAKNIAEAKAAKKQPLEPYINLGYEKDER